MTLMGCDAGQTLTGPDERREFNNGELVFTGDGDTSNVGNLLSSVTLLNTKCKTFKLFPP